MSSTSDRVTRLLTLVPYLVAHPGVTLAETANDFDVSESQVRRDLELLWMCGLPGHGPGDLVDLSFTDDSVSVVFDAGMSRPLRLTPDEALTVIVALRTLSDLPGLIERGAVERALAKVETAASGVDAAADAVSIDLGADVATLAVLESVLESGVALQLRYFVPSRNESTLRIVDPMRMIVADGRSYLEAWCRTAEGTRLFRVDRIDELVPLAEPAAVPEEAAPRDLRGGIYAPADDHLLVRLQLGPSLRWVAEYYSCETVEDIDGDPPVRIVTLRVADPAWVRSLVLGGGGEARVLAPGWLADDVDRAASDALSAYGARAQ